MIDASLLYVWDCLERAKESKHPYGGDVAEIFAQHLVPKEPTNDQWKHAGKTLYALLEQFCKVNRVEATVNGRKIGKWMEEFNLIHKCDVRIYED